MNIPKLQHHSSPQAPLPAVTLYPVPRRKAAASSLAFLPDKRRLELLIPSPTGQALGQFCEGALHLALVRRGTAAVLLHRFGGPPWRTAVCDGEALGKHRQQVYQALARERSAPFEFTAALIDPDTRAVLALRPATLSPVFASLIGKAMKTADSRAKDAEAQMGDLDWLLTQHPGDLISLAGIYERAMSAPVKPLRRIGHRLAGC